MCILPYFWLRGNLKFYLVLNLPSFKTLHFNINFKVKTRALFDTFVLLESFDNKEINLLKISSKIRVCHVGSVHHVLYIR